MTWNLAVVAHACNLSTQEAEAGDLSEFEASLVYRVSSKTARAVSEKPCLKKREAGGHGRPKTLSEVPH